MTTTENREIYVVWRGGRNPFLRIPHKKYEWTANPNKARLMSLPDAMEEAFKRNVTFGTLEDEDKS